MLLNIFLALFQAKLCNALYLKLGFLARNSLVQYKTPTRLAKENRVLLIVDMCLAIPQEVLKIKGKKAVVKSGSHPHQVDLSLLKNIKAGDFILAHQELAIGKISKSNAKKILKMINERRK